MTLLHTFNEDHFKRKTHQQANNHQELEMARI